MAKSAVLEFPQEEHLFKTVNHDVYFLSGKGVDRLLGSDRKTGNYFTFSLFGAAIAYAIKIVIFHAI